MPRDIPVRTFSGLAILRKGFFATLPNPGRVRTDNLQPFRISESGDFVGKAKLARLSVGILCPVLARLWLFYILAQLCGFVKNFFRTSDFACCGNCNPSVRFVSLSASCARYDSPCFGYVDSIAHILPKVKHYFRISEIVSRQFTHDGLFSVAVPAYV